MKKINRKQKAPAELSGSESDDECGYVCRFLYNTHQPEESSALNPNAPPFVPDHEMGGTMDQEVSDPNLPELGKLDIEEEEVSVPDGKDQPESAQASDDEPDLQPVNSYLQRE